jgi:hypothetical protein
MKRSSILVLGALAFFVNACEKHPASQLPPPHSTQFGDHAWSPKSGAKHGDSHGHGHGHAAPAADSHAAAPATPAAATPESPAGATPNLFPVKK